MLCHLILGNQLLKEVVHAAVRLQSHTQQQSAVEIRAKISHLTSSRVVALNRHLKALNVILLVISSRKVPDAAPCKNWGTDLCFGTSASSTANDASS
jgi:hypothetical protein